MTPSPTFGLKTVLTSTLATLGVSITLLLLGRPQVFMAAIRWQLAPDLAFSRETAPDAPDYTETEHWAAWPPRVDLADVQPPGLLAASSAPAVDVFFVHPTTHLRPTWNQALDDTSANRITDERILRYQASVFNACCAVYAPRYRQATLYAFDDRGGNGGQALQLAYEDIVHAFDVFLRTTGDRPFILAGHSQGTLHAVRLLKERLAGHAAFDRMVAAYLVGFSITMSELADAGIPVCTSAEQTRCVVGWNTMDGRGRGFAPDVADMVCVNPLTWTADDAYGDRTLHDGGVGFTQYVPTTDEGLAEMAVEIGIADAQCVEGNLMVHELRSTAFPARGRYNSMHVYDYSLFYANIRNNAVARARASLTARSTGEPLLVDDVAASPSNDSP